MSLKLFEPQEPGNYPVAIELPGLVHSGETTRVDNILEEFAAQNKLAGIRVTYDHVIAMPKDKMIICDFELQSALSNVEEAFQFISDKRGKYNLENISVISSSISAMVFAYYFASKIERSKGQNLFPRISSYVSISPLPGWRNFANQKTRDYIVSTRPNLPITSTHDEQKNVLRYIPKARLESLIGIDGIARLEQKNVQPYIPKMNVITLIGKNDVRADPAAMETYHKLLKGDTADIYKFESGHELPEEQFVPVIKNFLLEHISPAPLRMSA
jgi:hypothetical protein